MRTDLSLRSFVELTQGFDKDKTRLIMNQRTYDRLIILHGVSGYRKFNQVTVNIDQHMNDDVVSIEDKGHVSEITIHYS
jgi:hypothetical protein